jgi:alpha-amylase
MRSICFYFQVHQPYRLRQYRFFDIGKDHNYYDVYQNSYLARRIADKCYLPMNKLLLDLIEKYGSEFKVSFSISGTALEQFKEYTPEVIESFKKLADTGSVEFMAETFAHSLSALKSKTEFIKQVKHQSSLINELFGQQPQVFRNTELIYSDGIGEMVAEMGFKAMLSEGAKHILGWRSPNYIYNNAINPKLKLMLKNYQLSDDIAFRFSQRSWDGWPLTAEKFVDWLNNINQNEEVVNLFMDYETFGEHQWEETGIFNFMRALPEKVFNSSNFSFKTPSEVISEHQSVGSVHVPTPISWADEERDLTAWLGNELQDEAFDKLYSLESKISEINNPDLNKDWEFLQTSDHFYYMCTKWFSDGDVHKYFNPYGSPYESFINYMNVLSDFMIRIEQNYAELLASKNVKSDKNKKLILKFSDIDKLSKDELSQAFDTVSPNVIYNSLSNLEDEFQKAILFAISKKKRQEVETLINNGRIVSESQRRYARNKILREFNL